ncbi:MAG: CDP-alcohol phosphatidyltransferase family protein [Actinomycetia bacterium]|nr:CDP-alcohol phosphatidyltransferase family protein [Actinomycetes bacterium]MCP4958373.1 CDP-alcohol phosphatidyltransferase family protein [Actinomycetes bacterium]
MFDGNWRRGVDQVVKPIGRNLHRAGITADMLTILGLLMSAAMAVVVGMGYLQLGLVLLAATAIPDLLDGPVSKAAGTSSDRGAFFDSTADRVTDAMLLGGIAWYLASQPGAGRISVLPFAVMASSSLISYQRAKAESLGYDAKGGLMERAERILVLAVGLLFEGLLIPVLWVLLVATIGTAIYRFQKVWKQASKDRPTPAPRERAEWRTRRRARDQRRSSASPRRARRS